VEEESLCSVDAMLVIFVNFFAVFLMVTVLKDKFVSMLNYVPFHENVRVSGPTWK